MVIHRWFLPLPIMRSPYLILVLLVTLCIVIAVGSGVALNDDRRIPVIVLNSFAGVGGFLVTG
jgi:hypothetical protein